MGWPARFTSSQTGIGKELDSLADVVSFGVVPGAVLYTLLTFYFKSSGLQNDWLTMIYSSVGFIVTLFSALRLAKFNLMKGRRKGSSDWRHRHVPYLCLDFCSSSSEMISGLSASILNPTVLLGLVAVLSFLLIAEIPMFSFKFKNFGWAGNEIPLCVL